MATVTNLSSSASTVSNNQTFILIASVIGAPTAVTFEIPSSAPVVFTNTGTKTVSAQADGTGNQTVQVSVSMMGDPGFFDISAYASDSSKSYFSIQLT